jgi:hypothetical protein
MSLFIRPGTSRQTCRKGHDVLQMQEYMAGKMGNSLTPKASALSNDENCFMADISAILQEGRARSYAAVNFAMTAAYWEVGKRIVEQEQHGKERANYGDFLIRNLSVYLGQNFDKGFSVANLKNIRQFYLVFQNDQKGYTLCSKLSWSHIRLIMRLDSEKVRHYYLAEAREQNWSVRVLRGGKICRKKSILLGLLPVILSVLSMNSIMSNHRNLRCSAGGLALLMTVFLPWRQCTRF